MTERQTVPFREVLQKRQNRFANFSLYIIPHFRFGVKIPQMLLGQTEQIVQNSGFRQNCLQICNASFKAIL